MDFLPDDGTVRDEALKDIKTCQQFSLVNNQFSKITKNDRDKYFLNSIPRIHNQQDTFDILEMEQDMKGVYFPKKEELEQMQKFIDKNKKSLQKNAIKRVKKFQKIFKKVNTVN